jgi:thiol-disulfide isomerase/thioredoxin
MLSQNKKILIGLVGWLCLAAFALADVKIGAPFPDLETFGLEGSLPPREGRVVMIDFWATWCAPCKASFPAYSLMQKELAERGLTIIAVSVDKQKEPYADFVKKFAPAFTTVRDGGQKLVSSIKVPGMPTCYLVDRKGLLRVFHSGFHGDASVRELHEEITRLLEEKS